MNTVPEILREPLARWWERADGDEVFHRAHAELPEGLRDELPRVAAGSEFVASVLIQDREALGWFAHHLEPSEARAAGADYESRATAAATTAEAQRILREWRRRELLR
ncbi:MAG: hypothetical protein WA803_19435, partial [Steroidobacteraceae bacterium]